MPQPPGTKYSSVATISFAEDMNPRYRSTMEDAHSVVDEYGGDAGTGYFGIYDGHGGRNVAEYLRLHLHHTVQRELQGKGDRSVEECMKAAFLLTDIECADTGEQASGSTAAVCIVRRQGGKRYAYTANVGDARAVLCHAGVAVRLSKVSAGGPRVCCAASPLVPHSTRPLTAQALAHARCRTTRPRMRARRPVWRPLAGSSSASASWACWPSLAPSATSC